MRTEEVLLTDDIKTLADAGITEISAAIGVFDGVHSGHRCLLSRLIEMAEQNHSVPIVLTFSPHPKQVLVPEQAPLLLLPPDEKAKHLAACGVKAIVTIPFTKTLAAMTAEDFLDHCMADGKIRMRGLCVGCRFHCGAGGKGTTEVLAKYAVLRDMEFQAVPEYRIQGETVCSSAIRQAIAAGDLQKAALFLGHAPELEGIVEAGYGIAGRKLDHPTANLKIEYGILPPSGVYAVKGSAGDGIERTGIMNIGTCPTFGDGQPVRIEVHFFDFHRNLYDRRIQVKIEKLIRGEQKFSSPEALKEQIAADIRQVEEYFRKEI